MAYISENGVIRKMTKKEIENIPTVDKFTQTIELKRKLAETDYVACKIAEGVATKEEYAEKIKQRQLWREEINRLESEIQGLGTK